MSKKEVATYQIETTVHNWTVDLAGKEGRRYLVTTLPYQLVRQFFQPDIYRAENHRGEQRGIVENHARMISREILAHTYTPTTLSAGLRTRHRKQLVIENDVGRLLLSSDDPLPLTDGGHRNYAIGMVLRKAIEEGNEDLQKLVEQLPVTVLILLDGDTQLDFLNLQKGRPVDTSHMLALKMRQGMYNGQLQQEMEFAWKIARLLNTTKDCPFEKQIRFDSRGSLALPLSSLCSTAASNLATSLIGMARVCLYEGKETSSWVTISAEEAVNAALIVKNALEENAPELLEPDMPICPPPNGNRGSATMFLGVVTGLIYRLKEKGQLLPDENDVKQLCESCRTVFGVRKPGGFSGQGKRASMGEFMAEFYSGVKTDKHHGIPFDLLEILSCSAYGVPTFPRTKKKRGRKPKSEQTESTEE